MRGRDLGRFAAHVQAAVADGVDLPPGYSLEYGGQFENHERASRRLALVVPLAPFLIFLLLYSAFGAVRPALLIYFNIPIATTGGILALFVRGMPFNAAVAHRRGWKVREKARAGLSVSSSSPRSPTASDVQVRGAGQRVGDPDGHFHAAFSAGYATASAAFGR